MPVRKFLGTPSMNLPLAVFYQTITGDFPEFEGAVSAVQSDTDIFLTPGLRHPGRRAVGAGPDRSGDPRRLPSRRPPRRRPPRQVLRRVLALYAEKGWSPDRRAGSGPHLVDKNTDPDYPLKPPIGRSRASGDGAAGLFDQRGQRVRRPVRGHVRSTPSARAWRSTP